MERSVQSSIALELTRKKYYYTLLKKDIRCAEVPSKPATITAVILENILSIL